MKRQIRNSVFETNSSSVHSLTMCTEDEYKKWENGEVWFNSYKRKFISPFDPKEKYADDLEQFDNDEEREDAIWEWLREDGVYQTSAEYFDRNCEYAEGFEECYITPGGEKIVAFGYSGWDG